MKTKVQASALAAAVFGLSVAVQAGGPTPNYLTFTAREAGSKIRMGWSRAEAPEFNTNGTWETYGKNAELTLANVGDSVQFRAKDMVTALQPAQHFRMSGSLVASGSVTSLIDANGGDPDVALPEKCFYRMFASCTALTKAPELPTLKLTNECYSAMFAGAGITQAPKLPAKVLKKMCYQGMFSACESLERPAPMDHVTELAASCCKQMYYQSGVKAYLDDTHEGFTRPWKATSAAQVDGWSEDMFPATEGGVQGSVTAGQTYYVAKGIDYVTVEIPAVEGATAELYAFAVNGGWAEVASEEVPSNALVRVVWTADAGKGLTGAGAANVYQWQATFVADKAEQTAPAPTVGAAGASVVTVGIDTRAKKSYFDAKDILPVWYAQGEGVVVQAQGQAATGLVKDAANTNTVVWTPTEPNTYTLWYQGIFANIFYTLPVEVTTNGLAVAGTTVAVTADGAAIAPQTEGEFAGKLMVASNSTVKVTYTAADGVYFADGSTTYEATFTAGKSVNDAAAAIAGQKPEAPKAPNVKLGAIAQRYPWKGYVDVEYKAMNVPANKYEMKLWLEIGGVKDFALIGSIKTGVSKVGVNAKKKFGEVKGDVKVTAELVEMPPE